MTTAVHLPFDGANPYQTLLFDSLARSGVVCFGESWRWRIDEVIAKYSPDVIHFHWTHHWATGTRMVKFLAGSFRMTKVLRDFKRKGGTIAWTCHNLVGHEKTNAWRDRRASLNIASLADVVFVHSQAAADSVRNAFSLDSTKLVVIPHGNYIGCYENMIGKTAARAALGLGQADRVVLFLGNVRAYKGIGDLVAAFRNINDTGLRLIVAGRPFDETEQRVVAAMCEGDSRIRLDLGYVKDEKIQIYMNAADLVALPYKNILTSGSLVLAMSFGKAVLIPDVPMMTEVAGPAGILFNDKAGLRDALGAALSDPKMLEAKGAFALSRAAAWDWESIGRTIASAYVRGGVASLLQRDAS